MRPSFGASREWNWRAFSNGTGPTRSKSTRKSGWPGRSTKCFPTRSIGLCVVATPNDSHFSYTKACLEAGRDVVVDKPFTPTLAEAEQLVRLAAERGRLLTVYQDRRWDGDFQTVKKLVKSGAVGAVAEYEARFDRFRLESKPDAWREKADHPAAGVLWDLGPHLIDQALVLFGEPRNNLGLRPLPARDFDGRRCLRRDHWNIRRRAPRCARGFIAYAPSLICCFTGREGSFVKYGMDPQEEILRSDQLPGRTLTGARIGAWNRRNVGEL